MPKVLLLNPPGEKSYIRDNYCSYSSKANYFWAPIDLLVQSGHLSGGFELEVVDAIAERIGVEEVVSRVAGGNYDAIVSLIGSVSIDEDRVLFRELKKVSEARIAVSGDLCLNSSGRVFETCPEIDAALSNYSTPELADYLAEGGQERRYKHLAYRLGGEVVLPEGGDEGDGLMSYPAPRHEIFPLKRYRISTSLEKRFGTCIASLGCNFHCPFCVCSIIPLRLRDIDNLLEELHYLKSLGIRDIYFYDPNFTVNRKRCLEMLQAIIDADLDITFSCNSHVTVSEEVLQKLREAGGHTVMFGIENADERILKQYSKGITRERIHRTLAVCRGLGMRTFGYFLIGLPGETEETVTETIRFAIELPLNFASFNLPSPVDGTELYRETKERGMLRDLDRNADRSSEVSISLSEISDKRLLELKREAYRRFYLRPRFILSSIRDLYPLNKWSFLIKDVWTFLVRNFL